MNLSLLYKNYVLSIFLVSGQNLTFATPILIFTLPPRQLIPRISPTGHLLDLYFFPEWEWVEISKISPILLLVLCIFCTSYGVPLSNEGETTVPRRYTYIYHGS